MNLQVARKHFSTSLLIQRKLDHVQTLSVVIRFCFMAGIWYRNLSICERVSHISTKKPKNPQSCREVIKAVDELGVRITPRSNTVSQFERVAQLLDVYVLTE
ncbi:MAG: hypothetical protein OXO49_09420 [Gammaproteobacteria bacterium]|nr:hypothetical protein [Gammaproteobacteria bacterium]MDE0252801.1 hypothetical protein [Gammaproteobacteria bacterium]MDE0402189.1 hypothetical protein [Gammaproteobacteria bacterium]